MAKKVKLEEHIEHQKCKLKEFREHPRVHGDDQRKEVENRIKRLSDELNVRQESIDLLQGRLKNQITSFKETITKVLDSNISLVEKIRTLFREQGIFIASVLTAMGITIGYSLKH